MAVLTKHPMWNERFCLCGLQPSTLCSVTTDATEKLENTRIRVRILQPSGKRERDREKTVCIGSEALFLISNLQDLVIFIIEGKLNWLPNGGGGSGERRCLGYSGIDYISHDFPDPEELK